ncbi:MAG: Rne/Rng family ribonuclease [Proteobacteria bacterium]|nr:Rne/Rng family ribonuclease [Pseudomonadota bacterium]MBU4582618.1 Rne/Rng family ribonuclease [Pseudomonadota bacterium]
MKKQMLINAVHLEQKRMAIVEDGKLVEFNIQMAVREPITGNIYKGLVMKVERGLQAAFVNYGGRKDGFLPLKDVSSNYFTDTNGGRESARTMLKPGQEVLVQVLREVGERKGALLTAYISLPGRYLVLLPNKESSGISRKIEDEEDRKRLKELVEQIKTEDGVGFIVRTAGMNRTKQELARDYQHLSRLWKEIQKGASETAAPALIYQESAFGVRSLRDYFTTDIEEILVDDLETFRQVRAYCKAVAPRNLKMIKLDKEKTPLFDKYQLEDQIRVIYQDHVELKSGGYLIINPTEAMITIDVNSGRGSHKRNVEETAYQTNTEAAEEIARQLRLRDLGGLIVIDFIDMMDNKHNAEVEKVFKKAIALDRARIQLSHISKFGIMELSRQKKQSTIQEISYTPCPFCRGRGVRPSLEYTALNAYRKIETQAVKGLASMISISIPHEVADYLQNQKRAEINRLENHYDMSIHISGSPGMAWDEWKIETTKRETPPLPGPANHVRKAPEEPEKPEADEAEEEELPPPETEEEPEKAEPRPEGKKRRASKRGPRRKAAPKKVLPKEEKPKEEEAGPKTEAPAESNEPESNGAPAAEDKEPATETAKKRPRRRSRHRRRTPGEKSAETSSAAPQTPTAEQRPEAPPRETVRIKPPLAAVEPSAPKIGVSRPSEPSKGNAPPESPSRGIGNSEDPLQRLKKIFEALED